MDTITPQQHEWLVSVRDGRVSTLRRSNARTRMIENLKRGGYLDWGGRPVTPKGLKAIEEFDAAVKVRDEKLAAVRDRIKGGDYPVIELNVVDVKFYADSRVRVDTIHDGWHYWFSLDADHIEWPDVIHRNTDRRRGVVCRPFEEPFAAAVVGAALKVIHERSLIATALVIWKQKVAEKKAERNANIARNVKKRYAEEMFDALPACELTERIDAEIAKEIADPVSDMDYDV